MNDLNYGRSEELQISLNDAQVQLKTPADDQLGKKIYSLVHLQQKLSSAFATSLDSRLSRLVWISADGLAVRILYRSSSFCSGALVRNSRGRGGAGEAEGGQTDQQSVN